jgi:hypothetical protein
MKPVGVDTVIQESLFHVPSSGAFFAGNEPQSGTGGRRCPFLMKIQ